MGVTSTHMDNVSFNSKTSVEKWKSVLQIKFEVDRELGEETIKNIINEGPSCEKLINVFIRVNEGEETLLFLFTLDQLDDLCPSCS